jgi:uncharacterized integral membrane protein (TIGR00697 family)
MRTYKYLGAITALYITVQLVSDATAGKIIQIASLPFSVSVLYFPLTYIFSDVLTEVYGYAQSRKVVWLVLLCSVLAGILYQIAVYVPAAVGFMDGAAYVRVFGSVPRIVCGGWLAVWMGGIANDYVLAKMKVRMQGRYLWMRTIGSTIVGEGINTVVFYLIALSGILPTNLLFVSILSSWLIKVLIEILFTPITYSVVNHLKRVEQEDYFDRETNFNPFVLK